MSDTPDSERLRLDIGKALRQARRQQKLTQGQVATLAEVCENTVYLIENGADTRISTLVKAARAVGRRVRVSFTT